MTVQVLHSGEYELAEGARWLGDHMVFVDILSGRLLRLAGSHAVELARLNVPLGAAAPAAGGGWIVAAGTGIALLDASGTLNWLDRPEPATSRMNDGACDPAGRFWAGSMAYNAARGAGSLYRVDPDGSVHRVLDGLTVVNGPAFSANGRLMYVADTAAGVIYRCELDGGGIAERQPFAEPETGAPDGMTVDNAGRLWVALWDGAAVRCYQPDGSVWTTIALPAPRPTSVCLAGDRLLVTTARYGLDNATEASGAVLAVDVDTSAPPAASYKGAFAVQSR
jgi:sugar lactone lactonase YvrE